MSPRPAPRTRRVGVARVAGTPTLLQDGFPVVWTPVAKDAFDMPPAQRVRTIALQKIAVGETYDRLFTPTRAGTLHLELRVGNGALLVDHEIPVVN